MRVFCHMVVGPGEADRYLSSVLDRCLLWADVVHVTLDSRAGSEEQDIVSLRADMWERLSISWEDHEGRFRGEAWRMLELSDIEPGDFVVCLDADEVIVENAIVKPAAKEFPGHVVPFRFHEMWTSNLYRTDGHWKPYPGGIMFPYMKNGYFQDKAVACGREPTYATLLPRAKIVGNVLHYGYATDADRHAKYERYMRIDGGKYHSLTHLQSIASTNPTLESWNKGGLLG